MPRLANQAVVRNLFEGLGFRQSADDLLAGFPAAVCSKQVNALEFLQNVSFLADFAGAFQAGMSGHFNNSCRYVLLVSISIPFTKRPNILSFKGKSSRFCIFNVFFSFFLPDQAESGPRFRKIPCKWFAVKYITGHQDPAM